jgi:uncharacterized membrane protein YbhN (UPF0104 family)
MKRLLRLAGIAFALVAGGYFVSHAYSALSDRDLSTLVDVRVMAASGLLVICYASAIPITALGWLWILRMLRQPARYGHLAPVLAVTQFGKYLPGNVAQHIGRVALVKPSNAKKSAIVLSIVYETLLSVVACAHISTLTLLWRLPPELAHWRVVEYRQPLVALITAFAIAVLLTVPRVASGIAAYRSRRSGISSAQEPPAELRWRAVIGCYALYVLNITLTGLGLWFVAQALMGPTHPVPSMLFLTGAFASTWILGFLAPGSPAGLGVREGVLSAWLGTVMPTSQAIILILVLRIATTLGDLVNFAWGSAVMAKQKKMEAQPHGGDLPAGLP